jgi:hypothetical protein
MDQRVAGEEGEEQQPLEHAGQRFRQAEPRLRELAADIEHAHQHRRKNDADRVQPADEGDDDRGKAVSRRHVRRELAERPRDLEPAGQTGHAARQQQRRPQRLPRREPGIPRRGRCQAADLQLKAGIGAKEQDPEGADREQGDHQADVDAVAGKEPRDLRRLQESDRLRKVVPGRVLPRAVDQVAEHLIGDIDEHQADEDLVGIEAVAEEGHDAGPGHAADDTADDHRGDDPAPGLRPGGHGDAAGGDSAEDELAFGADVPDVGAEADGEAEADENERRRLDRELGECVDALQRLEEEDLQAAHRVLAEEQEECGARTTVSARASTATASDIEPGRLGAGLKLPHDLPRRDPAARQALLTQSPLIQAPICSPRPMRGDRSARCGPGHDDQPVAELEQLPRALADDEDGAAAVAQRQQLARICRRGADVDAPGRLRGDEKLRLGIDLAADQELLQVAAGEASRQGAGADALTWKRSMSRGGKARTRRRIQPTRRRRARARQQRVRASERSARRRGRALLGMKCTRRGGAAAAGRRCRPKSDRARRGARVLAREPA